MMRFASIVLLSAYCLVSLLGHAGFTALRGATLERVSANHSVHAGARESLDCQYGCPENHTDNAADEVDSCPSGCPDGCPAGVLEGVQTTVLCVTSSVFLKHKQLPVVPPVSNSIPSMFNCLLLGILSSHSIVRFGQDLVARRHSLRDRMNAVTSI